MTTTLDALRGRRYVPPVTPLELAQRARRVIDDSDRVADGGLMWSLGDPIGNLRRTVPGAWRTFGGPTIRAAATKLPPGTCRFCFAIADARVHRLPAPLATEATRLLLGEPCPRCRPGVVPLPARTTKITAAVSVAAASSHRVTVTFQGATPNVSLVHPEGCDAKTCAVSAAFAGRRCFPSLTEPGTYAVEVERGGLSFRRR